MLNTDDNIAYVMDDGLTSLSAYDVAKSGSYEVMKLANANRYFHLTFIGTGISFRSIESTDAKVYVAQNLPYGSHILKITRGGTHTVTIDGVDVQTGTLYSFEGCDIYQPKRPPIPEDAVVLADYCLFADYVATSTGDVPNISKGVRRISASRDIFYDASSGTPALAIDVLKNTGFQVVAGSTPSADVFQGNLPAFATIMEANGYGDRRQIYVDGGSAEAQTVVGSSYGACTKMNSAKTLGLYTFKSKNKASTDGDLDAIDIATPIHTSSHYQSFETPYLHELVGGDRNMEQTNLVVTPDGKTWDEVTRDTSYLSNIVVSCAKDDGQTSLGTIIWDEWRGKRHSSQNGMGELFNKDFAIAYDRMICLVDGWYEMLCQYHFNSSISDSDYAKIRKNGHDIGMSYMNDNANVTAAVSFWGRVELKRGDYIQVYGAILGTHENGYFEIKRLRKD